MHSFYFLVLATSVSHHFCEQVNGTFNKYRLHDKLITFLSEALHNYPTWVENNQLDPFQLTAEFVAIKSNKTNTTLTVTNQYVTGLSGITRVFNSAVSVGLDLRSFEVSFAINNKIILGGDYDATGVYDGNIQLNSRGKFTIVCNEFWQGISFENLTISDNDTYIHLHTGNSTYSNVPTFENVSFANIDLHDNQNQEMIEAINKELGTMYHSFITKKVLSSNNTAAIPSSRLFIRYINTLFWKTRITDILSEPSIQNWDAINQCDNFVPNNFIVILLLLLASYCIV